jgi:mono/diheme cytochrome c family protein
MFLSNKMTAVLKSTLAGLAMISLPLTAEDLVPREAPSGKRQQELRRLLAEDCGVCHGKLLQGDLAPPLTAESLAGKSDQELVRGIMEGHDETAMPPWWWMVDEDEALWLVRFIRGVRTGEK